MLNPADNRFIRNLVVALSIGEARSEHLSIRGSILLISIAIAVLWFILQYHQRKARGHPRWAHWLQGTSVWPRELIRLLMLITAVLFAQRGLRLLGGVRYDFLAVLTVPGS